MRFKRLVHDVSVTVSVTIHIMTNFVISVIRGESLSSQLCLTLVEHCTFKSTLYKDKAPCKFEMHVYSYSLYTY